MKRLPKEDKDIFFLFQIRNIVCLFFFGGGGEDQWPKNCMFEGNPHKFDKKVLINIQTYPGIFRYMTMQLEKNYSSIPILIFVLQLDKFCRKARVLD